MEFHLQSYKECHLLSNSIYNIISISTYYGTQFCIWQCFQVFDVLYHLAVVPTTWDKGHYLQSDIFSALCTRSITGHSSMMISSMLLPPEVGSTFRHCSEGRKLNHALVSVTCSVTRLGDFWKFYIINFLSKVVLLSGWLCGLFWITSLFN